MFTLCLLFPAEEFLYQDQWGGISLLNVGNLSERVLISNTTYVSTTPLSNQVLLDANDCVISGTHISNRKLRLPFYGLYYV